MAIRHSNECILRNESGVCLWLEQDVWPQINYKSDFIRASDIKPSNTGESGDSIITYDVEHDVVTQARGAVDAHEDSVFDGRAEAHRQPVCPRARPLVVGPRVRDQTPSFAKDVGGASCGDKSKEKKERN